MLSTRLAFIEGTATKIDGRNTHTPPPRVLEGSRRRGARLVLGANKSTIKRRPVDPHAKPKLQRRATVSSMPYTRAESVGVVPDAQSLSSINAHQLLQEHRGDKTDGCLESREQFVMRTPQLGLGSTSLRTHRGVSVFSNDQGRTMTRAPTNCTPSVT